MVVGKKIGVVGIGNMGWPMAARLISANFDVTVFDAVPERAQAFSRECGGMAAASLASVANDADAVITILPTSEHVTEVCDVVRGALRRDALVIEMSSGIPSVTRGLAHRFQAEGIAMIDAPVSGGVARARTGELAIMVGAEKAELARAEPCPARHGNDHHPCGPCRSGSGHEGVEQSCVRRRLF
jgi:3-hydroxyisobutyrate dehydrogenase